LQTVIERTQNKWSDKDTRQGETAQKTETRKTHRQWATRIYR